jgi:hypothetical protein
MILTRHPATDRTQPRRAGGLLCMSFRHVLSAFFRLVRSSGNRGRCIAFGRFFDRQLRVKVPASQVIVDELLEPVDRLVEAKSQCVPDDPPTNLTCRGWAALMSSSLAP